MCWNFVENLCSFLYLQKVNYVPSISIYINTNTTNEVFISSLPDFEMKRNCMPENFWFNKNETFVKLVEVIL